jgi:hypothetical protein
MRVGVSAEEQQDELVKWVDAGFREYADLCWRRGQVFVELTKVTVRRFEGENYSPEKIARMEYRGTIHRNIRIQIEGFADAFRRILRDEVKLPTHDDALALRYDLYELMKSGCPAVGLVELMLACTSDYGVTIPDLLFQALPLNDYLRHIKVESKERCSSTEPLWISGPPSGCTASRRSR